MYFGRVKSDGCSSCVSVSVFGAPCLKAENLPEVCVTSLGELWVCGWAVEKSRMYALVFDSGISTSQQWVRQSEASLYPPARCSSVHKLYKMHMCVSILCIQTHILMNRVQYGILQTYTAVHRVHGQTWFMVVLDSNCFQWYSTEARSCEYAHLFAAALGIRDQTFFNLPMWLVV